MVRIQYWQNVTKEDSQFFQVIRIVRGVLFIVKLYDMGILRALEGRVITRVKMKVFWYVLVL